MRNPQAVSCVSMIALGGPKLKLPGSRIRGTALPVVSKIALGGPKLKLPVWRWQAVCLTGFNDSTGWA